MMLRQPKHGARGIITFHRQFHVGKNYGGKSLGATKISVI